MSDVAALLAQFTGNSLQSSPDQAMAAIRLARASIDALVLRMGESIDARVVGQLAGGLTQLAAGGESFALKLPTPLPEGAAVTIRMQPAPDGQPAVTVRLATPARPPVPPAAPASQPANVVAATAAVRPATQPMPVSPTARPQPVPAGAPTVAPAASGSPPVPSTPAVLPRASPASAVRPQPAPPASLSSVPPGVTSSPPLPNAPLATSRPLVPPPLQPTAPVASPVAVASPAAAAAAAARPAILATAPGLPATPAAAPTPQLAPAATPAMPVFAQPVVVSDAARPLPQAPPMTLVASPPVSNTPAAPMVLASPSTPMAVAASLIAALPQPTTPPQPANPAATAQRPAAVAPQPLASSSRLQVAAPLNLADLGQVAARQDSAAPLLARLATVAAPGAGLPRPVIEVATRLLAGRLDLNRTQPDGTVLRDAVLGAGVLADAAGRRGTLRDGLLSLRSALLAVLGGDAEAVAPAPHRAAMPLRGDAPRAPLPQSPAGPEPLPSDTAKSLLGQTDAALSRLKLLQLASQSPDLPRSEAQPLRPELRVEIPMLLGAETAILQLQVERDARHRPTARERAWRMRFAVNFSVTGEVGAELALFGSTASVSLWAADPDTAEALEAMLPELSPALARHGLDVGSVRVRRGVPAARPRAGGQLLDNAR